MLTDGFTVFKQRADQKILYDIAYYKHSWDVPDRGHDRDGRYYTQNHESVEWGNYWTGPLNDNVRIHELRSVTDLLVSEFIDTPIFYHCDVSVLTPLCNTIRPHIDTPHRHAPWQNDLRPLGVQIAIPLNEVNTRSGTTAFVPGSHLKKWDIKKCYRGDYTELFLKQCEQPELEYGDILMWDCRILHSQMPNIRDSNRYMLLMNYLAEPIVKDVMDYEASLFSG